MFNTKGLMLAGTCITNIIIVLLLYIIHFWGGYPTKKSIHL